MTSRFSAAWSYIESYLPKCGLLIFVESACGESDIVVTRTVWCICVRASVPYSSVRNCPDHNFFNYGSISK